jgi:outer membrane protein OmpA-like peptidoglycan-associated protein
VGVHDHKTRVPVDSNLNKKATFLGLVLFLVSQTTISNDAVPAKDYPNIGRIPGYDAQVYEVKKFDSLEFQLKGHTVRADGRRIFTSYTCTQTSTQDCNSVQEVQKEFEAVLNKVAGEILVEDAASQSPNGHLIGRFSTDGQLVYLDVRPWNDGAGYDLTLLEEKDFESSMTATDAAGAGLADTLGKSGKAVLHIRFDFGKAALRADSAPIIQQIVKVMNAEPSATLEIDGHTDSVGSDDQNKTLSRQRADAVLAAIQSAGIAASRLKSAGFGSSVPLADNSTSEGRAQNRRVELIKK